MNRTVTKIILGIGVLLAVAGGSFFGGTLVGKKQAQATLTAAPQAGAFPGPARDGAVPGAGQRGIQGSAQGGMLIGQIQEIGDGMMVVTDSNGKQTQVKVTETTLIEKQASVTLADLAAGETVMVSGSKADDGSITARSVQVGAAGRFGAGGAPMGTRTP